jgi:signal transduction histidine kinase
VSAAPAPKPAPERLDLAGLRAEFPIFAARGAGFHYLDNAATGQICRAAAEALLAFETRARANVKRGVYRLADEATQAFERARAEIAAYLGAREAREVVITSGTTHALNIAAHSLCARLRPGDEILLSRAEHHSNIVPWQLAGARVGAVIRAIPLDDEGRLFLANVRQGVARMQELIDDLLAYSRMERKPLATTALDPRGIVENLLAERREELEARHVAVRLELPPLSLAADADGLAIVLRNLLDNALKFTRQTAHPEIVIQGETSGDGVHLAVRDNGIGFEMKYHDRIFEIFQRLHRLEDYPGTGVGLALVKKAIERMGGRVWAEAAPNAGATFHLWLPAATSG